MEDQTCSPLHHGTEQQRVKKLLCVSANISHASHLASLVRGAWGTVGPAQMQDLEKVLLCIAALLAVWDLPL